MRLVMHPCPSCANRGEDFWSVVLTLLLSTSLGSIVSAVPPERRVSVGPGGGYEGVTVAIAEGLDLERIDSLLDHLKALLRRTSDLLYEATGGKIFFAEVAILIPMSYNGITDAVYIGKLDDATIRIDRPNPNYGHLPYAQAAGPCGKGGQYIHLTPEAVSGETPANETVGDVARALVNVWARYRWGIFEEYGRPEDALYPYFREVSTGRWEPTGCSPGYNGILRTTSGRECLKGDDGRPEPECRFHPDERGASQEACIMYQHNLKSAPRFCSDGTHDRLAPNRQNNLCNHRSSWSVMREHEDFRTTLLDRPTKCDTHFHLATFSGDSPVNVLILLDVAKENQTRELWKYLRFGLKFLVNGLPYGSAIGIATYEGTGDKYRFKVKAPMTPLLSTAGIESLNDVIGSIKGGNVEGREAAQALEDAARMVDNGTHRGPVFLVFTQTGQGSGRISETTKIPMLQERRIRVMGLGFVDPQSAPGIPELCLKTGGRWVTSLKGEVTLWNDIKELMAFVLSSQSVDNRLYQMSAGILQLGTEETSELIVFVEKGLGRRPYFSIESAEGVMTTLMSPDRKTIDVSTDPRCRRVRGQHHCSFHSAESGNWTINATCLRSSCSSQTTVGFEAYSHERLVSEVREQPTVSFWTSGTDDDLIDCSKEDFFVYAHIRIGYTQVVGLDVTVTAESLNNSRNTYSTNLSDDGLDPDITPGDGVYTGVIFPETSETLLLSISIKGTGRTSLFQDKDRRWSVLPLDQGAVASGSNFDEAASPEREYVMQRTLVKFTTVKVTGVTGCKARPQLISDLRVVSHVKYDSGAAFVALRWTSPKPRDGTDKVKQYHLHFSYDLSAILGVDPAKNASTLRDEDIFPKGGLAPLTAGEEQTVITLVQLKRNITTAYFRIQSVNRLGSKSKLSRVVPVYLKGTEGNSTTNLKDDNVITPSTRDYFHAKIGVPSTEGGIPREAKVDLLDQSIVLRSNFSTGNHSSASRVTPVTKQPWFIPVVVAVCAIIALLALGAAALLIRSRNRGRTNSLKEAMLAWSCIKGGGGVIQKVGEDGEGAGKADGGNWGWNCMSQGYPSTRQLVARVGWVEANRWEATTGSPGVGGDPTEGPRGQGDGDEAGPECAGPYKEVFLRHPGDITTEL